MASEGDSDSDRDGSVVPPFTRPRRPTGQLGAYTPTFASAFRGAHASVEYVDLETGAVYRCLNEDTGLFAVQHARRPTHFKYAISVVTDVAGLLDPSRWETLTELLSEAEEFAETRASWPPPVLGATDTTLLSTSKREVVAVSVSNTVLTRPRTYVGTVTITVH